MVIGVVGFLLKSLVKVVLIFGLIYALFQIGFLWGGNEFMTKLHLDTFLKSSVREQVQKGYTDFSQKRDEKGVLETDAIKKAIDSTISDAVAKSLKDVQTVDKQKLLSDLSTKLQSFDTSTVQKILTDNQSKLAQYGITPQEVQTLIK